LTRLLFDDDVAAALTPELAVDAAQRAVLDAYEGRLHAPARIAADVGEGALVFTAGGYTDGRRGVRVYQTGLASSDQVVLVWDAEGHLAGCVVGVELGARRTGALGAVAADLLARTNASSLRCGWQATRRCRPPPTRSPSSPAASEAPGRHPPWRPRGPEERLRYHALCLDGPGGLRGRDCVRSSRSPGQPLRRGACVRHPAGSPASSQSPR
jgi:hypothetical protein